VKLSKTLWALLAAAFVTLVAPSAFASHFRYGNITWRLPNPQSAPLTVEFTVTHGWRSTLTDGFNLNFGDGTTSGFQQGTAIGSGVDANGEGYTIFEAKVTKTYAAPGFYKAFFGTCCRVASLVNASNASFRVETDVFLESDNTNTGGPISGIPVIIQMEVGGVRQFVLPVFDPDDDPFTCTFSTQGESGIPTNPPVLPAAQGGNVLTFVPPGCTIQWNLTNAVAGVKYATSIEVSSESNNGVSKTTIDYIIELVPPNTVPTCTGGGNFSADVGMPFSHTMQFADPNNQNLALTVNGAPAGSTVVPPSGSTLTPAYPKPVTFNWTPALADAGTTRLIQFSGKDPTNFSGFCTIIITVPECAGFGLPCCQGVGACENCGTQVCIGNQTVCSASPGAPSTEMCNGVDDDCDGTIDDNPADAGLVCSSGLPGVCDAGTTVCNGGTLSCDPDIQPGTQPETCNSLDDDCDGQTDEGFGVGDSCTVGLGICEASGQIICDGLGGAMCNATPGTPQTEICATMFDEDCDGQLNNGCPDSDGDGIIDAVEILIGTDPNDADSDDDGVPDGLEPGATCLDFPECFVDTDGDGLINPLDPDSDNDGLLDGTEMGFDCMGTGTNIAAGNCVPDGDAGATTTDPLDPDTDNGGVSDGSEDVNLNGVIDPGETDPTAGNGADDSNPVNLDSDGDGLSDNLEISLGSDPNDADTDDDGVLDGLEPNPTLDSDGDGLINLLDVDSDNDGLYDGTEMGFDCSHPDTDPGPPSHCTADGDDGVTKTSPLKWDTDDGGVSDGSEDSNLNGVVDAGETNPTAGNGADDTNPANTDSDGDGLSDALEIFLGSDPNNADSDNDGVLDGFEPNPSDDADGDGLINLLDVDSDDDGLYDGTEMGFDCSHPDTDPGPPSHCIPDGDAGATTTNPLLKDTDGGGVSDGSEDANLNGVVDAGEADPNDASDDVNVVDSDGDGLSDDLELFLGSDPNDADSDDDGLLDGDEHNPADNNDSDWFINLLDVDSDDDGLYDGTEAGKDCSHADTAPGHCIADADPSTKTSPLKWDTDGGGASDGSEDPNLNGAIDTGEQDPNDPSDDGDVIDTDGDGLSDALEIFIGTDPNNLDSDNDGLLDGSENNPADDQDGDGDANAADPDADGDGLFDGTENGLDCSHADTDPAAMTCIPDGDAGATVTNHLDADTDGGGKSDGDEDTNKNGVVDQGETDPNDPSDDGQECFVDADCGGPQSGIVCHDRSKTCVPGCRGVNGNGCPDGEECTSMDETIGECIPIGGEGGGGAGAGGEGPGGQGPGVGGSGGNQGTNGSGGNNLNGPIEARGGCACEAPAGRSGSLPWALALAGLSVAALRRRGRAA
jgi:hypothetical protein